MLPRLSRFAVTLGLAAVCCGAALAQPARPEPPRPEGEPKRGAVDAYGDALPELAVARLGTLRWRQPLRDGAGYAHVCFSADGRFVASPADAGFCLWEVATGKPVDWLRDDARMLASAFSADGKTLITVEEPVSQREAADPLRVQRLIRHREASSGRVLREFPITSSRFGADIHLFSADGGLLAVNHSYGKLHIWDAQTGKLLFQSEQALSFGYRFGLSADGRRVALASKDGDLLVFDIATGKELRRIAYDGDRPEVNGYYMPALSPEGKTLLASSGNALFIWDVASGQLRHKVEDCRGHVAYSADGAHLAVGEPKGIRLWEAVSLKEVRRFEAPLGFIRYLAFSRDGRFIVTGVAHSVALWDVATGRQFNALPTHEGAVHAVAFAPDGKGLASGADDGLALLWDLPAGRVAQRLSGHVPAAHALAFSPDGRSLATGEGLPNAGFGTREQHIRLWNRADGRKTLEFSAHLNTVDSLAFSPSGMMLASGGGDGRARVWDTATGTRLYQIRGEATRYAAEFSPDGQFLLAAPASGEPLLCRASSGEPVHVLASTGARSRFVGARFIASGKSAVALEVGAGGFSASGQLHFWDAATGREERTLSLPGIFPYYDNDRSGRAVSADGKMAATVSGGNSRAAPGIQLWDTTAGKLFCVLYGHSGAVTALAFAPDGKQLASASRDTTVLLWDVPRARLHGLWTALAGAAEETAWAAKSLAANPDEAVDFLAERLRLAAKLEAPFTRLIADLDDDDIAVRNKASQMLAETAAAEFALRLAAGQGAQPSTQVRFEELTRQAADFARKGDYARTIGLREEALKINPEHLDQRRFLIDDYLRLLANNKVSGLKPEEHTLENAQYRGFLTERLSMWQACYGHYKKLLLTGKIDQAEAVRRTHIMLDYPPHALMKAFPKEAESLRLDFVREVFPWIGKILSSSPHASTQLSEWEQWRDLSMFAVRRFDRGHVAGADLDLLADLIIKVIPDKTPLSNSLYFFLQQRPDDLSRANQLPGKFTERDYLGFLERLKKSEGKTAQMYGRYGWVYYHWLKPRGTGALPGPEVLAEAEALLKIFPRDNDYVYIGMRDLRYYVDKELNPHKYPVSKVEPQPIAKKPERSTGLLTYHPLDIKVKTLQGDIVPFKGQRWQNYHGWSSLVHMTPCEDGLDVFWNNGAVAFMKEKGLLEEIFVDPKPIIDDVKWDGVRVWIATRKEGLWVVSRGGKILARIGAKEGLPPCEHRIMLLPLAVGKVCAVGSVGEFGHAWCAIAAQPEPGPARVHVFHRTERVWASEDEGKEVEFSRDPAITFRPQWLHLYRRAPGQDPLILVGRYATTYPGRQIPLAINARTLDVGVADFQTYFADHRISDAYFSTGGKLLEAGNFGTYLLQPKPADANKPKVFAQTNNGMIKPYFLPHAGKLYLAGGLWFEIDPLTLTERRLTPQRLPSEFESLHYHGVSTHYGLIGWNDGALFQISVAPEKKGS